MSKEAPQPEGFVPPVSVFAGPIAELVGHRLLSPPTRPGLLASLGRFEILRVLGGGGMGVVVLARDSETGKEAAVKLIRPELVADQRVVHRFVKEAGHLQKLKHPGVVPVSEISDRREGPYFVMPYFERGSLAGRIRPGQPLEADEILGIARQVADGLGFAHRHGIIHRDLKPANILLGAEGKCCLADFGLARSMFNDSIIDVERDQMEGTAPYMSPGVAAGHAEDTRCDIYSFGALLYEMLTGEPPYAGRNTNEIRRQILDGPPKNIRTRNPTADAGLVIVAEGAMARELRDRYADMADVLADLERIKVGKSPVGPHGISNRVKQVPVSMWVPGGVVMIAVGLWLLWSGSKEKTPQTIPVAVTNSAPRVVELPHPAIVSNIVPTIVPPVKQPEPTPLPETKWRVAILAGQPGVMGSNDGIVSEARFRSPGGIAVDTSGNVYVADMGNDTVRKIANGSVTTVAGKAGHPGDRDGHGDAARLFAPRGIAVDGEGNVYVAEFASDVIRKITPAGDVNTLAGSAGNPGSKEGSGDNAYFRNPWSVAAMPSNSIYIVDRDNFTIRQITANGGVGTFAGAARMPGWADGPGSYARFRDPQGIAVDGGGNIYVADTGNDVIRKIDRSGRVTTIAGKPDRPGSTDGAGDKARFMNVESVAASATIAGPVYALDGDSVREVTPDGVVTTLTGIALIDSGGQAMHPTSLAADAKGTLYLADAANNVIWTASPP